MVTSRTGTAKWKNLRKRALHNAQAAGLTRCPCRDVTCKSHRGRTCNVPLDYTTGQRPNSAVPDHIKHHALGGQDTIENIQVICNRCNAHDGARLGNAIMRGKRPQTVQSITF
ncbi:HNH endonuclease [Leucobacter sp. CSA1]|uniref:HNH endonuclease n=1 Tax=Leucobacter chromiisoli TaxID=2796471 RepID=A0A934UWQ9_9MICO|nr:HNH endonuclease [Leucobacter chromiisoli]